VTLELFRAILEEELHEVVGPAGASEHAYDDAAWLLDRLVSDDEFVDFLTEPRTSSWRPYDAQEIVAA
jgi:hypothetical protein